MFAQFALEEEDDEISTETDSDISISEDSDSSDSDAETPVQPPAKLSSQRGRGVRTRGLQRTSNERSEWSDWASSPFNPTILPFTAIPGPTIDLPDTIKDHVHLLLTDELINDIQGGHSI